MKIRVKDIPISGAVFTGVVGVKQLDADTFYWSLVKDLQLTVEGYRAGDYINLNIVGVSEKKVICTRCLETEVSPYKVSFSHQVKITDELEEIDIVDLVRQEIILGIGIRQLCSQDCQGLCSVCGGNKNRGECRCKESEIERRQRAYGTSKEKAFQVKKGQA